MRLNSAEVLKQRFRGSKNKKALQSKKVEYRLILELKEKLIQYLTENEKVMLEVNPRVTGEFLNVLNDKFLASYEYEQIDKNKFIFYSKEFSL